MKLNIISNIYHNKILPKIEILPILDKIQNTKISKYYKFLLDSEKWSLDRLERYQKKKLNSILKWAYNTVPFYRKKFSKFNFNPNIDSFSSRNFEELPIINKNDIQQNFKDFISIKKSRYLITHTSGSTGHPTTFLKDFNTISMGSACYYRFLSWYGYKVGDPYIWLWGGRPVNSLFKRNIERFRNFLMNIQKLDTHKMNIHTAQKYYQKIYKKKPRILYGYVSSLDKLVDLVKNESPPDIKAIVSSAEILSEKTRERISKAFNCPVYDQYGTSEITSIAAECQMCTGFHISMEHVYLEIIKDNQIAQPNEKGEIVVTDLDNYQMPLIRYNINDISSISNNKCRCGRELLLLDKIEGRKSDIIIGNNGKQVHGEFFAHLIESTGFYEKFNITQFQVIQNKQKSLVIKFKTNNYPHENDFEGLSRIIRAFLGNILIRYEIVDEIPLHESGKLRYTISEL